MSGVREFGQVSERLRQRRVAIFAKSTQQARLKRGFGEKCRARMRNGRPKG